MAGNFWEWVSWYVSQVYDNTLPLIEKYWVKTALTMCLLLTPIAFQKTWGVNAFPPGVTATVDVNGSELADVYGWRADEWWEWVQDTVPPKPTTHKPSPEVLARIMAMEMKHQHAMDSLDMRSAELKDKSAELKDKSAELRKEIDRLNVKRIALEKKIQMLKSANKAFAEVAKQLDVVSKQLIIIKNKSLSTDTSSVLHDMLINNQ